MVLLVVYHAKDPISLLNKVLSLGGNSTNEKRLRRMIKTLDG